MDACVAVRGLSSPPLLSSPFLPSSLHFFAPSLSFPLSLSLSLSPFMCFSSFPISLSPFIALSLFSLNLFLYHTLQLILLSLSPSLSYLFLSHLSLSPPPPPDRLYKR